MIVTIVHNDTDAVKRHLHELRQGLEHIRPHIIFKSCCIWEFRRNIFQENEHVLVLISRQNPRFARLVYKSLAKQNYRRCRVGIVLEGHDSGIVEKFKSLLRPEYVADVEDLSCTFTWFPKVCVFLLRNKRDSYQSNKSCVVPKVSTNAKHEKLRDSIKMSLKEFGLKVADDFNKAKTRSCCILFRRANEDLEPGLKEQIDNIVKNGGKVIEYSLIHNSTLDNTDDHVDGLALGENIAISDEQSTDNVNRVTYGADKPVLFILHVLRIFGLINVTKTGKREISSIFEGLTTFDFKYYDKHEQPNKLLRFCGLTVLSLFVNPTMLLFFFTPFPYIALRQCVRTGKARYWNITLIIWMLTFNIMLAISSLVLCFVLGLGALSLVVIPVCIPLGLSAWVQIRYSLITVISVRKGAALARSVTDIRQDSSSDDEKTLNGLSVRNSIRLEHAGQETPSKRKKAIDNKPVRKPKVRAQQARPQHVRRGPQFHLAHTSTANRPVHKPRAPLRAQMHRVKTTTSKPVRKPAVYSRPRRVDVRPAANLYQAARKPDRQPTVQSRLRRYDALQVVKPRHAKFTGKQVSKAATRKNVKPVRIQRTGQDRKVINS